MPPSTTPPKLEESLAALKSDLAIKEIERHKMPSAHPTMQPIDGSKMNRTTLGNSDGWMQYLTKIATLGLFAQGSVQSPEKHRVTRGASDASASIASVTLSPNISLPTFNRGCISGAKVTDIDGSTFTFSCKDEIGAMSGKECTWDSQTGNTVMYNPNTPCSLNKETFPTAIMQGEAQRNSTAIADLGNNTVMVFTYLGPENQNDPHINILINNIIAYNTPYTEGIGDGDATDDNPSVGACIKKQNIFDTAIIAKDSNITLQGAIVATIGPTAHVPNNCGKSNNPVLVQINNIILLKGNAQSTTIGAQSTASTTIPAPKNANYVELVRDQNNGTCLLVGQKLGNWTVGNPARVEILKVYDIIRPTNTTMNATETLDAIEVLQHAFGAGNVTISPPDASQTTFTITTPTVDSTTTKKPTTEKCCATESSAPSWFTSASKAATSLLSTTETPRHDATSSDSSSASQHKSSPQHSPTTKCEGCTTENPTAQPHKAPHEESQGSNAGAIAGGVIGGIGVVAALYALYSFIANKTQNTASSSTHFGFNFGKSARGITSVVPFCTGLGSSLTQCFSCNKANDTQSMSLTGGGGD